MSTTLFEPSPRLMPIGEFTEELMRRFFRKNAIVPLVFAISVVISIAAIWFFDSYNLQQKKSALQKLSSNHVSLIRNNIYRALSATYPLAALVRTQKGKVDGFEKLAEEMMPFYPGAASLQLAPDGVIRHIVPLNGNEKALGHNLFADESRNKEAFLARATGQLTLAGPFELIQGGQAAAARLPIYLNNAQGKPEFWGFSVVLISFPEVLKVANLHQLAQSGVAYRLSRIHPDSGELQVIDRSPQSLLASSVKISFKVPNSTWTFAVSPVEGWRSNQILLLELLLSFIFVGLSSLSASLVVSLKDSHQLLQKKVAFKTRKLNDNLKRLGLALNAARQGWFDIELETGEIRVSEQYPKLLGYHADEFKPSMQEWRKSLHPDDQKAVSTQFVKCLSTRAPCEAEYRRKNKSGQWLWIHSIAEVIEWGASNRPLRMVGIHTDITERKRNEQVLRTLAESGSSYNDEIFQIIVRQLARTLGVRIALIAVNSKRQNGMVDTVAMWDGEVYRENFSYAIKGTPCEEIEDKQSIFYQQRLQKIYPDNLLLKELNVDSCLVERLDNSQGQAIGHIALLHDHPMSLQSSNLKLLDSLTVRASIELERKESEEKLSLLSRVFKDTHEGIMITDAKGNIVDVNASFCETTGYTREEVVGQNPRILNSGKQGPEFYAQMWQALNENGFWQGEAWNRKKSGEFYAELLTISSLKDESGEVLNYVGLFSDITKNKEQQKTLELMAHYDLLTELPNRALFSDRFSRAISHSKRTETLLAVCFLDLDLFKPVNDQFGHQIGDKLLIEVANRIKHSVREEDTVSRQGGDEFTLLLGDLESIASCEHTLQRILQAVAEPYKIDGNIIHISASIGVTFYPLDNADLDTLLRHADRAMYDAKIAGRNDYSLYSIENDRQAIQKNIQLKEIQRALANQEFCLYYQPKVNMKTGSVFGVEALIRWQHPTKGMIPPLEFLPLIDRTDLEIQIGEWVINAALNQVDLWRAQGVNLEVSVNIAPHHLLSNAFIKSLEQALKTYPLVPTDRLCIEILASSVLSDLQTINRVVKECLDTLGVRAALDDFGTGYSSLTHLRNLPVSSIKIDQSFVKDMLDDPDDFAIIESVIGLSNSFGREVIAEGVESCQHGQLLLLMGCELAQGYTIAKPMVAADVPNWLAGYQVPPEWTEFAEKALPKTESKRRILEIISERWLETVCSIKQSQEPLHSCDSFSEIEPRHINNWIERARVEKLFEVDWLSGLEQVKIEIVEKAKMIVATEQFDLIGNYHGELQKLAHEFRSKIARLIEPD